MPFNALRASAFTRATCSMATCTFCLNSSGEFGSTRVDPVVVVVVTPVVSWDRLGKDDEVELKLDECPGIDARLEKADAVEDWDWDAWGVPKDDADG